MDNSGSWSRTQVLNGVQSVTLSSWQAFDEFLDHGDIRVQDYIWRGQAQDWPLLPELWRDVGRYTACGYDPESLAVHLDNFKRAYRSVPHAEPEPKDDDSWWALGRHYGLATPLLDWTESPFIAAFFAFVEDDGSSCRTRTVYALDLNCAALAANALACSGERPDKGTGGMGHIVRPRDGNQRLHAQQGLFTYLPVGLNIENWLGSWRADLTGKAVLLKVHIPDHERYVFLAHLGCRDISSLTMYPDPQGAAEYCNIHALAHGEKRGTLPQFLIRSASSESRGHDGSDCGDWRRSFKPQAASI